MGFGGSEQSSMEKLITITKPSSTFNKQGLPPWRRKSMAQSHNFPGFPCFPGLQLLIKAIIQSHYSKNRQYFALWINHNFCFTKKEFLKKLILIYE